MQKPLCTVYVCVCVCVCVCVRAHTRARSHECVCRHWAKCVSAYVHTFPHTGNCAGLLRHSLRCSPRDSASASAPSRATISACPALYFGTSVLCSKDTETARTRHPTVNAGGRKRESRSDKSVQGPRHSLFYASPTTTVSEEVVVVTATYLMDRWVGDSPTRGLLPRAESIDF